MSDLGKRDKRKVREEKRNKFSHIHIAVALELRYLLRSPSDLAEIWTAGFWHPVLQSEWCDRRSEVWGGRYWPCTVAALWSFLVLLCSLFHVLLPCCFGWLLSTICATFETLLYPYIDHSGVCLLACARGCFTSHFEKVFSTLKILVSLCVVDF